jgi:hypothetical protein
MHIQPQNDEDKALARSMSEPESEYRMGRFFFPQT